MKRKRLVIALTLLTLALAGGGAVAWQLPSVQNLVLSHQDLNALTDRVNANPADWRAQYWYGRRSAEAGDLQNAEKSLRVCLGSRPDFEPAITQLGKVVLAEGRVEEAFQLLRMAVGRNPHDAEAQVALAFLYRSQGAADRGIATASDVLSREPNNVRALYELGASQSLIQHYPEAETAMRRSLKVAPDDVPSLLGLARVLLAQGKLDEAEANARKALRNQMGNSEAVVVLAQILQKKAPVAEHREEALRLLQQARTTDPNNVEIAMQMAEIDCAAGRWVQALPELLTVVRADPHRTQAFFLLARTLRQVGKPADTARAEATFHKLERYEQQVAVLGQQIATHPDDASLRFKLADLHADVGRRGLAIASYRAGLERDPQNAGAREHLRQLLQEAVSK